ncbi:hypothetical protein DSO57_1002087 [Entomophthora muscae]|uniref:Uncharacterized protein n=1 Tax=Entomophthora muscae TaxID=34485 RepID=A0ACC2S030_9FUNG|nr:hypothetical protein DSO57_1002087 [Entomophthora muscae]
MSNLPVIVLFWRSKTLVSWPPDLIFPDAMMNPTCSVQDTLARIKLLNRYNRQDSWHTNESRLLRDKYNSLSTYQLDMEPPITPRPMPASAPETPLDHTNNLFGIVYITLTGVIDTIISAAGLWSWMEKVDVLPY